MKWNKAEGLGLDSISPLLPFLWKLSLPPHTTAPWQDEVSPPSPSTSLRPSGKLILHLLGGYELVHVVPHTFWGKVSEKPKTFQSTYLQPGSVGQCLGGVKWNHEEAENVNVPSPHTAHLSGKTTH